MAKRKLTQSRLSAQSFVPITPTPTPTLQIPFRSRKIRRASSQSDPPLKPDTNHKPLPDHLPLPLPRPLTASGELAAALAHLRAADPLLSRIIDTHSPPTFQSLRAPFHALSRSILYQQLALKAAATIYNRFLALCGGESCIVPNVVLALTPQQLRQIGVSARKASYLHDLAANFLSGGLTDESVVTMDDHSLFERLTMVKGIGPWSVHMFMIFTLHRPDVLPVGDLSIRKGVKVLYGLKEVPVPSKVEELCEHWKPYRSVGSWYMYRLIEDKGPTVTVAVPIAGGVPTVAVAVPIAGGVPGGEGEGNAADQEMPQLVEPIQVNA